jgi:tetratricopeptide (TPR) repeat protein
MGIRSFLLTALLIAVSCPAVPASFEENFNNLKEAVSQKNASRVQQLASEVLEEALVSSLEPAPTDSAAKEDWKKRMAWYASVQSYAEYALYSTASQASPEDCLNLLAVLEEKTPKSKYMEVAYPLYFQALTKTGASAKIQSVAENALKVFPENEDILQVLMESALAKKDSASALRHAERLIAAYGKHTRPSEIPEADWQRKRSAALGRAYYIAGMIYSDRRQYPAADRNLRSALPLIKGNKSMEAPILFYLGVANYQLGSMTRNKARVLEAVQFSEQAAAIESDYSLQAWRNAQAMKDEARKMR